MYTVTVEKKANENNNFGISLKLYLMTALKFGFQINIFSTILVFVIYLLEYIKYKLVLMPVSITYFTRVKSQSTTANINKEM